MGLWRVVLAALIAATALPPASVAAADPPGRYIVIFRDRVEPHGKTAEVERRLGFASEFRYSAAVRGFAATLNASQLARLRTDPDVALVAADRTVRIVDTVPIVGGDTAPTGVRRMNAATATTAHAASTVAVAVIDSGVDLQHSDLNVTSGINCISPGTPARDDNGHGTHVAGSIAAKNNGSGVIGVAPGTRIYSVKVINAQGSGTDAQVVCGIDWVTANAASLGIKIANVSLGGDGVDDGNCGNTNNDVVHRAICASVAAGVTYIVAAGNSGQNLAANYPASYDEVLTVTAMSDFDGQPGGTGSAGCFDGFFEGDDFVAGFSNFTTVDSPDAAHTIAGPGVCITSTRMGGGTTSMSGTSMATPHVAGVAALCFGEAGNTGPCTGLTPAQVLARLRADAASAMATFGFEGDPRHPLADLYYGYLAAVDPPRDTTPPVISQVAVDAKDREATVSWTTDEVADSVVEYGTTAAYGSTATDADFVTAHGVDLTGLTPTTTYHFRVRSTDASGNATTSADGTFSTIAPSTDLALSAAALPATVEPGTTVRYLLSVTNGGPSAASGVQLVDTLPANATFLAASSTQGNCGTAGGTVTCAIGALTANPVLVDRPAGYWRLGDRAGSSTAADAAGANAGAFSGAVTLETPGAVSGDTAASFAGGVATIAPNAAFNLSGALTVEAWVKPAVAGGNGGIVEKTVGGQVNSQYLLFVEGGRIRFRVKQTDGNLVTALGPTLAAGSWSHVAGTYDGSTLRVFVNGALAASTAATPPASGSGPLLIGRLGAEGGAASIYPWSGAIDEVAVYSRALTGARIAAHAAGASAVATARVTIDVRANGGTLTNTAQVQGAEADPNGANNTITQAVSVAAPQADLALTQAPVPASVETGATVRYTLSATNAGPAPASGVTVSDTVAANGTLVAASSTQGSCGTSGQTVTCPIGTLSVNPVLVDHPLAYWRLGDPAGSTVAADFAGTSAGTYSGAFALETAGALAGDPAATLSGGVVTIPATAPIESPTFSVTAWVRPSAGGASGGIFEKTIGGQVNTRYLLFVENGQLKLRVRTGGGAHVTVLGPAVPGGTWSHVAGTYDGATLRLYLNGALAGSGAAASVASGSGPALIGRLGAEGGNPSIYPFNGAIDEVAVFGSALTGARIQAHHAAGGAVATARVTIDVRAAAGTLTNTASVSAPGDPNAANDTVSSSTTVNAPPPPPSPTADVTLAAAPPPASVEVGTTVRYVLSASNAGPSSATGVQVADTVGANGALLSALTSQGSCGTSGQSATCAVGTLLPNPVLVDRPVAYWRLGELAGAASAADAAGTSTGTYAGATLEVGGAVPGDTAASFAGAGGVTIPASAALNLTSALSVEAWVRPAAVGSNGGIYEKTIGGTVNTQLLLFVEGGAIKLRGKQSATSGLVTAVGPQLPAATWSHVVGTYDGATLRLYVNGTLAASVSAAPLASGSGAAFIGRLGAEGSNASIYPWSGAIDEVAVYSSALSAARVSAHFTNAATNVTTARMSIEVRANAGGTLTNTAQAQASETDPNTANNSVSTSVTVSVPSADIGVTGVALPDPVAVGATLRYTVSVTNAGPATASGAALDASLPASSALLSASATQGTCGPSAQGAGCAIGSLAANPVLVDRPVAYWRLGDPSGAASARDSRGAHHGTYLGATLDVAGAVPGDTAASFAGAGAVTIPANSALDLTTSFSVEAWVRPASAGGSGGIYEKTIGGAVNTQLLLFVEGGAIKLRGKQAASGHVTVVGPQLAAGSWSHVAGTYDGATLRLYVNGVLAGSASAAPLASGSGPVLIGRLGSEGSSASIYPFNGAIDEVAVYSSALSAARVSAHFTGAATRVTTARITIDVRPTAAGTATATMQASATSADPDAGNNSVSFATLVN